MLAEGPLKEQLRAILAKVKTTPGYKPTAEEAALIQQATTQTDPRHRVKMQPRLNAIRRKEGW